MSWLDALLQGAAGTNGTNGTDGAAPISYPPDASDSIVWRCDDSAGTLVNTGTAGSDANLTFTAGATGVTILAAGLTHDAIQFGESCTGSYQPRGGSTVIPGASRTLSGWFFIPRNCVFEGSTTPNYLVAKWSAAGDCSEDIGISIYEDGTCGYEENGTLKANTTSLFAFDQWNFIAIGCDGANYWASVNGNAASIGDAVSTPYGFGTGPWTINGYLESGSVGNFCKGLLVQDVRLASVSRNSLWCKAAWKYGMGRRY